MYPCMTAAGSTVNLHRVEEAFFFGGPGKGGCLLALFGIVRASAGTTLAETVLALCNRWGWCVLPAINFTEMALQHH